MSSFTCCAVIPVYNHHKKIGSVVERLLGFGLSVILIDDGSEPLCAGVLDELNQLDDVQLIRLPQNSGKGAAVCEGLRHAHVQGFTHALQIDADGQHDLNDVPRFLAVAERYPAAVISGARDYAQMPKVRARGRAFSDFWVRVNSLSCHLQDAMCGYRLYPLAFTMALLAKRKVGQRMDFDIDMLVRLYWRGADVINIPTAIIYADEIPSHFDMLRDNVRITWMQIRLVFGMFLRAPKLIMRKPLKADISWPATASVSAPTAASTRAQETA